MIKLYIRSIYAFFIVGLLAVILAPPAVILFIVSFTGLRTAASGLMYEIAKFASKTIVFCAGCGVIVGGTENIPPKGNTGICFVCNHSGIMDILLLFITAGRPFGFIAKKEIMFVPFINLWLALLGGIFLDRKSPRKSLDAINHGIQKIKKGRSMAIFPEGTRSRGRGLLPFKPGAFHLAVASGADIVPVALTGSYEVFEKRGMVCPRTLYVSFGKVIKTTADESGGKRQVYSDRAHTEIEALLKAHEADFRARSHEKYGGV
jgi:1-acyl-sn-glycerol-3-phosphate acyltransferase